jgi:1-acyl-sn-glycerol-3-phosphate acyltransferase
MIRAFIGRNILRLIGWRAEGWKDLPPKCIIIGHPHTSNWDFILFLFARWAMGLKIHFVGKHTLFKPPLGWLMRAIGGVAVNRSGGQNSVAAIAEVFEHHERLALGIAPSGSRSYNSHWRSGFYHIAKTAQVPIVLGYVDYTEKLVGLSQFAVELTGDVPTDMDKIRSFYADKKGRYPAKQNPMFLRSETEESEAIKPVAKKD